MFLICLYIVKRPAYLWLWALFAVSTTIAQEAVPVTFETFTINDGLSQGFISTIIQDKQGFMWVGTRDGLNKYDGYSFTVLHHDPTNQNSLAGDDINCLFEDSQGRLWIGLRGKGIDIFDPDLNKFKHIRESRGGLRSDFVFNIYQDRSGAFWIRSRGGIDRLEFVNDSLLFTPIEMDTSFESERIKTGVEGFLVDSRNRKFISTNEIVYELIFDDKLRTYRKTERFRFTAGVRYFIGALMEDTLNHCIYLNTSNAIWKFPDYNFGNARKLSTYEGNDIRWTLDNRHQLWLLGPDHIKQVNTRTTRQRKITADAVDQMKFIKATTFFYTDRTGVVWIGSGGYGLIKYDPATAGFHHLLQGANIYQLLEDKEGRIITNTLNAVIITEDSVRTNPNHIPSPVMRNEFILSCTMDTAGNFWYGKSGSLVRYNPKTKSLEEITVPYTEFITQPFPVLADKTNNIWMGFNRYLVRYNWLTKEFSRFEYPGKIGQYEFDFLQSMYQDEDLLWLGSVNGLICFDTRTEKMLRTYTSHDSDSTSIGENVAYSFCADVEQPERYLWVGTKGGGLNRLDKATGKFVRFGTSQGLSNNVVYGILPDYAGNLWLSTNKGLSEFNTKDGTFSNFDVSDGLQSNEFNRYAYLRTSQGFMVFGGLNGINYFRTDEIRPLDPPKVVFTGFRLFNRLVNPGTPGSPLHKTIGATRHIELLYEQNVITFQFAAMDYRKKGSIRYRYRLEGFDKDWIYAGTQHEATYTNLDPGNYTFIVQASFENGQWSTGNTSLTLKIITPWYRTWWFFTLVGCTVSCITYILYRFRLYQLRRLEKLRNRIARDLHDEVGSSISTIAIYSKIVHEQMSDLNLDNESLLRKISDSATEIMGSMNDIVWNINTKNDAFEHIISHMREHAMQLFEAKGALLHFNFEESLLRLKLGMEKRREFYLIYKEALNNIVKYAEASNVWISFALQHNNIILRIKDDGKGFDSNNPKKSGNGLTNMQQRAAILNGKISIYSSPGNGTEVQLNFPNV